MKSLIFVSDYQAINLLDVIVSHMNVFNSVVTCYMRSSHIYSILSMLSLVHIPDILKHSIIVHKPMGVPMHPPPHDPP